MVYGPGQIRFMGHVIYNSNGKLGPITYSDQEIHDVNENPNQKPN